MYEADLTTGSVYRVLYSFALPFLLSNLLQALYGAADMLIIGYFSDAAGISAVANGSQIMQTIICFVTGLTTGGTVLVGRYAGAKDNLSIIHTAESMIVVCGALTLVLTSSMLMLSKQITAVMQVPAAAAAGTTSYTSICSLGIAFIFIYNASSAVFRGMGDSRTPLFIVAVGVSVNIVLDLLFVGALDYGVKGAAAATVIAQGLCAAMSILKIIKLEIYHLFKADKKKLRANINRIKELLVIGIPISLQDTLVMMSFLLITMAVNRLGLVASAALGISERINTFTLLPPIAFSGAVAAMTAQNMGAGEIKRAIECMRIGIIMSLAFGIPTFIALEIVPEYLSAIFTSDTDVIKGAAMYLRGFSFDCVCVCFVFCMNGFFNGCRNTAYTMINNLAATFLIRIPVTLLFSLEQDASLFKIGLAAPIASIFSIILHFIFYRSGKWRN